MALKAEVRGAESETSDGPDCAYLKVQASEIAAPQLARNDLALLWLVLLISPFLYPRQPVDERSGLIAGLAAGFELQTSHPFRVVRAMNWVVFHKVLLVEALWLQMCSLKLQRSQVRSSD